MRTFKLTFAFIILSQVLLVSQMSGQTNQDRSDIIKKTNVDNLLKLSKTFSERYLLNKAKAIRIAEENGFLINFSDSRGKFAELQGISESGELYYYFIDNENAAATLSTNEVHLYGSLGLNLDGTDMIIGEWDGGAVLTTHQEFNNTGNARAIQNDGAVTTSSHSTHVAGTLIAGGVVRRAKGMSYNAELSAHDWNNDESEMAAAAAGGLLISNHSYGFGAGWEWTGTEWVWYGNNGISTEEDFRFGFYGYYSRDWDQIAHDAPYYLICKSSGNDRGEGEGEPGHPADGGIDGYDCIGWIGNAKNILTVGAVLDLNGGYTGNPADVEMTSFSSWGPCDDGRIKPDICGNGYSLYSSYDGDNSDYEYSDGTSMSSPNVAGSLLLLQEHFNETHGFFMKSAALKALAVHTADECGPDPGPDYIFGWGLMNTETAVNVITYRNISSIINEEIYTGSEFSFDVTATGTEPLIVTIVWTDIPGTPVANQLDPITPMLVNDLDLTVSNVTTFYPYMLDRDNPSNAAATGDNDVDNVEKIFIESPDPGTYTITINHEGTISGGTQDFSIIVTGVEIPGAPTDLTVTPSSSDQIDISWSRNDDLDNVLLAWSSDGIFGVPEDGVIYTPGQVLAGGGTILYYGDLENFQHGGLIQNKTYYYKVWSNKNSETEYSAGISESAATLCGIISEFPWTEDFETVNANDYCMDIEYVSGDNVDWEFRTGSSSSTPPNAHSGIFNASVKDADTDDDETLLILPQMDLSGVSNMNLLFWHTQAALFSFQDELTVLYKSNPLDDWTEIESYTNSIIEWTEESLNLPNLSDQYQIAFKGNVKGGKGICIDDISVDFSSEIENSNKNEVLINPNPTNGIVNIHINKIHDQINIIVFDITGRIIYSGVEKNSEKFKIDFSDKPKGIYIIKFSFGNNSDTSKIIIQ